MKKYVSFLLMSMMLMASSIFASVQVNDVTFSNMMSFSWQVRFSYSGIWKTDVGYFYLNNWTSDVGIYGSYRNIKGTDVGEFYESLLPLEKNLLPYATPSWSAGATYNVLSEKDIALDALPAKELLINIILPSGKKEVVIAYLTMQEKWGLFSSSTVGYTICFSCNKDNFEKDQAEIQSLVQGIYIQK